GQKVTPGGKDSATVELRRALTAMCRLSDGADGREFAQALVVRQHEDCAGPLRQGELRGPLGQEPEDLALVGFGIIVSTRTHGLYYVIAKFLARCTNSFQISLPAPCFVVDEAKSPAAEAATGHKTGQAVNHL